MTIRSFKMDFLRPVALAAAALVLAGGSMLAQEDPPTVTLGIVEHHTGMMNAGDIGDTFVITVINTGTNPTTGTVTVMDMLGPGLTPTAIAGTGWTCTLATLTCTRGDALAAGGNSFPPIVVTVNVAPRIPRSLTSVATVSGGGMTGTVSTFDDGQAFGTPPDLTITKTHRGNFSQGDMGDTYTITVTNSGLNPTMGTVAVGDILPAGLTATAFSGNGWTCMPVGGAPVAPAGGSVPELAAPTLFCSRTDSLPGGASYPPITLTVNVTGNPGNVTNQAMVGGGSEVNMANDLASDLTTITAAMVTVTVTTAPATNLQVMVDGQAFQSPAVLSWVPSSMHTIGVSMMEKIGNSFFGQTYTFANWSDAGAISHTVTAPASGSATFTANFTTMGR